MDCFYGALVAIAPAEDFNVLVPRRNLAPGAGLKQWAVFFAQHWCNFKLASDAGAECRVVSGVVGTRREQTGTWPGALWQVPEDLEPAP
jgi:hypothetical protein